MNTMDKESQEARERFLANTSEEQQQLLGMGRTMIQNHLEDLATGKGGPNTAKMLRMVVESYINFTLGEVE